MVNLTHWPILFLTGLLVLTVSTAANAKAIAKVDREVVAVDESLMLTVTIDKTGSVSTPSFSGIRSNFHIISNNQSSSHRYVNGESESSTQWQLTLIPKHTGQLVIPALIIDGEKTLPITIDVRPAVPQSQADLQPVYIESEVDNTEIYVQQQLIYTVRIFQSVQLDNMNVSEPEFDKAAVKKLSQNSYQRRIKNTPYRVHELKYAIFPQQSGELTIPEAVFTANETVARRSLFNFPGQGRAIRKMSKQHTVAVKDIPAQFTGNTWLPAKSVALEQSWSADPDTIRVGESITRSITIKAQGLLDSQLPPIDIPSLAGAKFYPDKGQTNSTETGKGVNSSRTDSTALIPTQEGTLVLPEVRLSWWDTSSNTQREALIPQSTVTVQPALGDSLATASTAKDHSQIQAPVSKPMTVIKDNTIVYWQLACAVLAIAWMLTTYLWLSLKRQRQAITQSGDIEKPSITLTEKQAFKTLSSVCHRNDINTVRKTIIDWAQLHWPDQSIVSLEDIKKQCQYQPLINELLLLDSCLYNSDSSDSQWNGENLLAVIRQMIEQEKQQAHTSTPTLAPLYPG